MARPIKTNADYFPHDADMRNDPKVKALRRKFGHLGYSVWNMLLETLTDSDNFEISFNDLNVELLSGDFDIEPTELSEILHYCKSVQLISIENNIAFSKRLKERFSPLIHKRERDRKRVFGSENTQSKVKESKVKESKVNITPKRSNKNSTQIDFDSIFNSQSFETILRMIDHKINYDRLQQLWEKFKIELVAKDDLYRTKEDYRKHFPSWVKVQLEKNVNNGGIMRVHGVLTD